MRRSGLEIFILVISFLGVIACAAYLYIDQAPLRATESKDSSLGYIKPQGNDVRLRGTQESTWAKVQNDAIIYGEDRVFTGNDSTAIVGLNTHEKLTISPNSLIVIDNRNNKMKINIDKGSLFGFFKKGSKYIIRKNNIETLIEAKNEDASIAIQSDAKNQMKLVVLRGELSVKNQPQISKDEAANSENLNESAVVENQEVVLKENTEATIQTPPELNPVAQETENLNPAERTPSDPPPPALPTIQVTTLTGHLIAPGPDEIIWSGANINFKWSWEKNSEIPTQVEIAEDPNFTSGLIQADGNQNTTHIKLPHPGTYFWRIKNKTQDTETSAVASFSYFKDTPPEIPTLKKFTLPVDWQKKNESAIQLSWQDEGFSEKYKIQISDSREFSKILFSTQTEKPLLNVRDLNQGIYYWKVESLHPNRSALISNIGKIIVETIVDIKLPIADFSTTETKPQNIEPNSLSKGPSEASLFDKKVQNKEVDQGMLRPPPNLIRQVAQEKPDIITEPPPPPPEPLVEKPAVKEAQTPKFIFSESIPGSEKSIIPNNISKKTEEQDIVFSEKKTAPSASASSPLPVSSSKPTPSPEAAPIANSTVDKSFDSRLSSNSSSEVSAAEKPKTVSTASNSSARIDSSAGASDSIKDPLPHSLFQQKWIQIGFGSKASTFPQSFFDSTQWLFGAGAMLNSESGMDFTYEELSRTFKNNSSSSQAYQPYKLLSYNADYLKLSKRGTGLWNCNDELYFRMGLQNSTLSMQVPRGAMPSLGINSAGTNVSLGLDYKFLLNAKGRVEILLRYYLPAAYLSTSLGGNLGIANGFSYDNSIGYIYKLDNKYSLGAYFMGQSKDYNIKFDSNGTANEYLLKVITSTIDVRLKYEF